MNQIADYDRKLRAYLKIDNRGPFVSCKTSQEMRQLVSLVRETQKTFGTVDHHKIQHFLKRWNERCDYKPKPVPVSKTEMIVLDVTRDIKTLTPATFEAVSNQLIDSQCLQNYSQAYSIAVLILEYAMKDPKQTKICMDLCFTIHRAEFTSARTTYFANALLKANQQNVAFVMGKDLAMRSLVHRAYQSSMMEFTENEEFNLRLYRRQMIALASVSSELYRLKLMSDKDMNGLCSEIAGEWCETGNLNGEIKLTGMNLLMINFGVALISGICPYWSEQNAKELPLHHYVAYLQRLKTSLAPKTVKDILKLEEKLFSKNDKSRTVEVTRF